jgi:hypothetical protein
MDVSVFIPYIVSIAITLLYASVGKLSSGEAFNEKKFIETLGVQIVAMIGIGLAGYPELTAVLPTLVTAVLMKVYSYYKKKKAGII